MKITNGDRSVEFEITELGSLESATNGGSSFQELAKRIKSFIERLL